MDATGPELPAEIADALSAKAKGSPGRMLLLAILAGAFIAFGSIGFLVVQGVPQSSGPVQLLSGVAFSVGLILVMVTGAELFTGNTMMVLPASRGQVGWGRVIGAWGIVWIGNLIGAVAVAVMFVLADGGAGAEGMIGDAAAATAATKTGKGAGMLVASGILANMLVCLAVWMATGAQTIGGKVAAIVGPVTVFVAAGFEHSVANMSLLPIGWMLDTSGDVHAAGVTANLAFSTIGNVIGGGIIALACAYGHGGVSDD